jgi:hypothetical protein
MVEGPASLFGWKRIAAATDDIGVKQLATIALIRDAGE